MIGSCRTKVEMGIQLCGAKFDEVSLTIILMDDDDDDDEI